MTILDRMLFLSFLRAYIICLGSTLSLYIIVDLFTHLDDFAVKANNFFDIILNIANYYGYRSIQYYDRLCEAIALLAAMFSVAWMQRSNELLPCLSAGVSTHRVIRPIVFGSVMMVLLGIANQELVIPKIASVLMTERDDPDSEKELWVHGNFDPNGVHIEGVAATRKELSIREFYATLPETASSNMVHLSAATARYIPPREEDPLSGGWLLSGTTPAEIEPENRPESLVPIYTGRYFLKTREITFDTLTRNPKWYMFASTHHLYKLLNKPGAPRQGQIAVMFHMKISRPIIGVLLVILGLSIILRDQTRHVFISAGLCLAMCAVFYGVVYTCKFLGDGDIVSPALSAWLPVIIFGPITMAQYDAIHT
jgi:lipopolysaccharide export system permease protein